MIRLQKISSFDPQYLKQFYSQNPGIENAEYSFQLTYLLKDRYGWSDFWKSNLERTGRFVVDEVVINADALQRSWEKAHSIPLNSGTPLLDIVRAQVRAFQPNILFTHDFSFITPAFRKSIRHLAPSIQLIIGYDGTSRNNKQQFEGCDLMLTCNEETMEYYQRAGFKATYFKLGFETSLLSEIRQTAEHFECSFVGNIMLGHNCHESRLRLLASCADETPLVIFTSVPTDYRFLRTRAGFLSRGNVRKAIGDVIRDYNCLRGLRNRIRPPRFGLAMYQTLASSRISLNVHIDAARSRAGNMRMFEATGTASCLLTDRKHNLSEFFTADKEVVTYDGPADCIEKIRYLIDNPTRCADLAAAGQARTLSSHTLNASILQFASEYL